MEYSFSSASVVFDFALVLPATYYILFGGGIRCLRSLVLSGPVRCLVLSVRCRFWPFLDVLYYFRVASRVPWNTVLRRRNAWMVRTSLTLIAAHLCCSSHAALVSPAILWIPLAISFSLYLVRVISPTSRHCKNHVTAKFLSSVFIFIPDPSKKERCQRMPYFLLAPTFTDVDSFRFCLHTCVLDCRSFPCCASHSMLSIGSVSRIWSFSDHFARLPTVAHPAISCRIVGRCYIVLFFRRLFYFRLEILPDCRALGS